MGWAPRDLENLLPVFLDRSEVNTLSFLGVFLVQVEQVHIMIVAHIRSRDIVVIFTEAEGGNRSAPLRQGHHVDSLRCLRIPNEDHWFKTDLSSRDTSPVRADCQSHDVITMAKLALGCLLALLN